MLSSNFRISTTDSHSIIDLCKNKRINRAGDVMIGNHVWVGADVTINKNVTIFDDSVVSGNSVVNHDVARKKQLWQVFPQGM